MGKEDKYAKRRKHLSSLMKAIFGYKSVDFCDETKDTGTIILGCKSDPMDCTFTDHYKVKYFKILEIAFTYDKYEFVFCNEKKQNKTKCDRYTIITNTINFFKRKNIDVDYQFDSEYEKRLFFKLLYRFTLQLIESLFLFKNDADAKKDNDCISEYNKRIKSIREHVLRHDIIELIYSYAKLENVEMFFDTFYKESECNDYFLHYLIPNYYSIIEGIDICIHRNKRPPRVIIRSEESKSYKINYSKFNGRYLIKIIDKPICYKRPSYCCLKTNYDRIDEEGYYMANAIWDDLVDMETKEIDIVSHRLFKLMPYYRERIEEENIRLLIQCCQIILQINYDKFLGQMQIPDELKNGYLSFGYKIKRFKVMETDAIPIMFRYLFACWVDKIWRNLEKNSEKVLKKSFKSTKDKIEPGCIKKAEQNYDVFFNNHIDTIKKYRGLVYGASDFEFEGVFADKAGKIYNPFTYLFKTIRIIFGDTNEQWLYDDFDPDSTFIELNSKKSPDSY